MKKFLIFYSLIVLALGCRGEVFWRDLWFGGGTQSAKKNVLADELLKVEPLYSEDLSINGYDTRMEVGNADASFAELYGWLSKLKLSDWIADGTSMRFSSEIAPGTVRKYLLVNMGDFIPAVVFWVDLPIKIPPVRYWPSGLPEIHGAKLEKVIKFPGKNAVYCSFELTDVPENAMRQATDEMQSRGFVSLGDETFSSGNTGRIFVEQKSNRIFFIALDRENRGVMYCRNGGKIK